jgi:hypothetical protein
MDRNYDYQSDFHVDLAVEVMKKLLENHEAMNQTNALTTEERAEAIAADSFCIAEAMIKQIESL